jgi:hypothetical protein
MSTTDDEFSSSDDESSSDGESASGSGVKPGKEKEPRKEPRKPVLKKGDLVTALMDNQGADLHEAELAFMKVRNTHHTRRAPTQHRPLVCRRELTRTYMCAHRVT